MESTHQDKVDRIHDEYKVKQQVRIAKELRKRKYEVRNIATLLGVSKNEVLYMLQSK